jgi:hypothetical protein
MMSHVACTYLAVAHSTPGRTQRLRVPAPLGWGRLLRECQGKRWRSDRAKCCAFSMQFSLNVVVLFDSSHDLFFYSCALHCTVFFHAVARCVVRASPRRRHSWPPMDWRRHWSRCTGVKLWTYVGDTMYDFAMFCFDVCS